MDLSGRLVALSLLVAVASLTSACSVGAEHETSAPAGLDGLFATSEQQAVLAECLDRAGWDVSFDPDTGSVLTEIPEGQEGAYNDAARECSVEAGIAVEGALTAEELAAVFDWYTQIARCLEDEGWTVPVRPSLGAFIDTYDTDPWIPWAEVPSEQNAEALEACPIMKPPTAR